MGIIVDSWCMMRISGEVCNISPLGRDIDKNYRSQIQDIQITQQKTFHKCEVGGTIRHNHCCEGNHPFSWGYPLPPMSSHTHCYSRLLYIHANIMVGWCLFCCRQLVMPCCFPPCCRFTPLTIIDHVHWVLQVMFLIFAQPCPVMVVTLWRDRQRPPKPIELGYPHYGSGDTHQQSRIPSAIVADQVHHL